MIARCFDSNILIDSLNGVAAARAELGSVDIRVVSIMTWIEVLAGTRSDGENTATRRLLTEDFRVLPVDLAIAEGALTIRREQRVKLVDAIILATARQNGLQLSTRNTKDFSEDDPTIRVPYRL